MAFPLILVDSASGSDSTASGAGPSTALSGTSNASTNGTGLIVTLPSGTVLTGVSTTGSDVLFLNDSTAGNRNFGKITATSGSGGSTPTVTVSDAFGASLASKSWAIGGKRASVGSTSSYKFFDNNSASGDLMPGWTVELQSGHSETLSAPLIFRRAGDATSGAITLQGKFGAATMPLLSFSNSGRALDLTSAASLRYLVIRDFELRNTNATKTGSTAIDLGSSNFDNRATVIGMKVAHATNFFNRGCIPGECSLILGCEFGYCATTGIDSFAASFADNRWQSYLRNNCHHCGSHGIYFDAGGGGGGNTIEWNRCWLNGGDGIRATSLQGVTLLHNTCDANTGSGLYVTTAKAGWILNNGLTNNGAYGVNFNGASAAALCEIVVLNNNTYLNTSGAYSTSGVASGDPAANPTYSSASTGDFTPSNSATQAGY